jgi:uncharacterized protein (TIGR00290 family)
MEQVVVSWSGGKDASLALRETRRHPDREALELLTTVHADNDRVSMHGVRRDLVARQAASLGLPLRTVPIPADASNETYAARLADPMADYAERGVDRMVFADLFLEGIREYREDRLAETPLEGAWPLWGRDTDALAREFVGAGFEARIACVDGDALGPEWAGRRVDDSFFAALPEAVDPCGEHGEFHTFVTDGPGFAEPVPVDVAEVVTKPVGDGEYHYADLVPAEG